MPSLAARIEGLDRASTWKALAETWLATGDRYEVARHVSIDEDNAYFHGIRSRWGDALREAFAELPDPDWLSERTI